MTFQFDAETRLIGFDGTDGDNSIFSLKPVTVSAKCKITVDTASNNPATDLIHSSQTLLIALSVSIPVIVVITFAVVIFVLVKRKSDQAKEAQAKEAVANEAKVKEEEGKKTNLATQENTAQKDKVIDQEEFVTHRPIMAPSKVETEEISETENEERP